MNSNKDKIRNCSKNLKILEEKYINLFQESPFSIVLLNRRGDIIDCNLYTEKMFGYKREELIGKNYLRLTVYPLELRPKIKRVFEDLVNGEFIEPTEFQIKKKDGNIVSIIAFISMVASEYQTIIQALVLDISERKRYEETIKRKLQIEKTISTILSKFISGSEIDKALYHSLKEIGNLYGADRAYILLRDGDDLLNLFIQVSCLEENGIELIKADSIEFTEFPWCSEEYSKNGYVFISNRLKLPPSARKIKLILKHLDIQSILIYPLIIKGNLKGFLGLDKLKKSLKWNKNDALSTRTCSEIISNALDRKWSDETLRGSNQLLAGILSSLTESILLIDKSFNVVWTNSVFKAKFGKKPSEQKCYEMLVNQNKPCLGCIALKTFCDGLTHETELNLYDLEKHSMVFWVTSTSAALDYNGETELALIILRDITNKKEIEEKLRRMNENLIQKVEERTVELKKSEENYKRMLNELDVGFYRGEFKGKLLKHNIAFNNILGIDPKKSLIGARSSQFFINQETQEEYYKTLTEKGNIQNFLAEILAPNGDLIKVQLNSHLIRNQDGLPSIVEGTIIKL